MESIKNLIKMISEFIRNHDIDPTLVSFHDSGVIIMDTDKEDWRKHFIIPYGVKNKMYINKMTMINDVENISLNELAYTQEEKSFKQNFNPNLMNKTIFELHMVTKLKKVYNFKQSILTHKNNMRSVNINIKDKQVELNVNIENSGNTVQYIINRNYNKDYQNISLNIESKNIDSLIANLNRLNPYGAVYIYIEKDKQKNTSKLVMVQNGLSYFTDCTIGLSS